MPIHAFIASIRTDPEPAILLIFHSLDKVLADLIGSRPRIPMFTLHNVPQFFLIPIVHGIGLLLLLLRLFRIPRIRVNILFGRLPLDAQIMAELALLPLLTMTLFEEDAENRLGIHAKRHLLHLHRLKQVRRLPFGFFRCLLFCCSTVFFRLSFLFVLIFAVLYLGLQLGDLFFGCSSFFLYR